MAASEDGLRSRGRDRETEEVKERPESGEGDGGGVQNHANETRAHRGPDRPYVSLPSLKQSSLYIHCAC